MANPNHTRPTDTAATAALLDIDRALTQAHAILRVIGGAVVDALPPQTLPEACWAVCDLVKFANDRAADLARVAQRAEDRT